MRPWVALTHAGANFSRKTVELVHMQQEADYSQGTIDVTNIEPTPLADRRELGSVHGLFPVLRVDGVPIHESLAICEYVADAYPAAGLWPDDAVNRAL
jgi:glutathione S-transferase